MLYQAQPGERAKQPRPSVRVPEHAYVCFSAVHHMPACGSGFSSSLLEVMKHEELGLVHTYPSPDLGFMILLCVCEARHGKWRSLRLRVSSPQVEREWVGLRPGRASVRLEAEDIPLPAGDGPAVALSVIHCYGAFTLVSSWVDVACKPVRGTATVRVLL